VLKKEYVYAKSINATKELQAMEPEFVLSSQFLVNHMHHLNENGYNYRDFIPILKTIFESKSFFEKNRLAIASAFCRQDGKHRFFSFVSQNVIDGLIIAVFGTRFFKENGELLRKELIEMESHSNNSISQVLDGIGMPSKASSKSSHLKNLMERWINGEMESAKQSKESHYLVYLAQSLDHR
jgi:hypothetical protein